LEGLGFQPSRYVVENVAALERLRFCFLRFGAFFRSLLKAPLISCDLRRGLEAASFQNWRQVEVLSGL